MMVKSRSKTGPTSQKWLKTGKNGPKMFKLGQNWVLNWSKLVPTG
jgi:hypothetical protein